jgi:hypothetical protein
MRPRAALGVEHGAPDVARAADAVAASEQRDGVRHLLEAHGAVLEAPFGEEDGDTVASRELRVACDLVDEHLVLVGLGQSAAHDSFRSLVLSPFL